MQSRGPLLGGKISRGVRISDIFSSIWLIIPLPRQCVMEDIIQKKTSNYKNRGRTVAKEAIEP